MRRTQDESSTESAMRFARNSSTTTHAIIILVNVLPAADVDDVRHGLSGVCAALHSGCSGQSSILERPVDCKYRTVPFIVILACRSHFFSMVRYVGAI